MRSSFLHSFQFFRFAVAVGVPIMVQLTVFFEFLSVCVFGHHAQTPAACSATKAVAPIIWLIPRSNKYSIRLLRKWSIHATILLAFTTFSTDSMPVIILTSPSSTQQDILDEDLVSDRFQSQGSLRLCCCFQHQIALNRRGTPRLEDRTVRPL